MEPILKVNDLNINFSTRAGSVQAVRGISYTLHKGEVLGIVGESGSGKSVSSMSILKLLEKNAIIDSGSAVEYDGKNLLSAERKVINTVRGAKIAMIFQDPMTCLNPLMKVGKQIYEVIREHTPGISKADAKAKAIDLLNQVKIPSAEKRYDAYPHEFSGGMRQRAMIAMAIACDPDILIADEPTTALDVTIQAQIIRLLKGLQREKNIAILFITHDLGVVAEICTRVAVMYGGKILEIGTSEEIFKRPSHPYTLGLMAAIPRVDQDRQAPLTPIAGSPPDMLMPPAGCPFYPPCEHARNISIDHMPEPHTLSEIPSSRGRPRDGEAPRQGNPCTKEAST